MDTTWLGWTDEEWDRAIEERLEYVREVQEDLLDELRRTGAAEARMQQITRELVVRAREAQVPAQRVADAAGISRQQVYRITGHVDRTAYMRL